MNVTILGAGVIGVTSAYYLAKAGHQVTVIDRQSGPALETSFANAGEISPGYASPWAAPGIPQKARKMAVHEARAADHPAAAQCRDDPMVHRHAAQLHVGALCGQQEPHGAPRRIFAATVLIALRDETGIAYDHRTQGTLQLFRTQKQLDGIAKDIEVLRQDGVPFEVLDRAGCVAAEPGLAATRDKIVGGLRLPNDETGDCFMFTNALAELARSARRALPLSASRSAASACRASASRWSKPTRAISRRIASSPRSAASRPRWSARSGCDVPVYPVKGYSITVPIVDENARAGLHHHGRDLQGRDHPARRPHPRRRHGGDRRLRQDLHESRRGTLVHSVEDLFGGAGDQTRATFWTGLRPMTPDGTPVIGRDALSQPLSQHRPRHARLDHGVRLGARARRHDRGTGARDRDRRSRARALRVSWSTELRSPGRTEENGRAVEDGIIPKFATVESD